IPAIISGSWRSPLLLGIMRSAKRHHSNSKAIVNLGDCVEFLRTIASDSIQLTLTSPPYCIGKEYDGYATLSDFIALHKRVLPEVARVTKPGGSICWQVGYHLAKSTITPLDYFVYDICSYIPDLVLRNRIIWTFGHGYHCSRRFSGRHEVILWFTKGEKFYFNLDRVRVPQKYPGKRGYKGAKKGIFTCNPLGKNPSDVWEIPNVKANHVEKTNHPCQFPIGLVIRIIRALS